MGVLNEYKAAHPAAPVPLARKMDGALLAIGTLSDVLKVGRGGVGTAFVGWAGRTAACPAHSRLLVTLFTAVHRRLPLLIALQEKKPYNGQLEPMLLQHVVPLFESPHGHLR